MSAPVVAAAILFAVEPGATGNPVCLYARCTGHACPGCGLTRALAALIRGDITASWNLHPLALLVAAELAVGWIAWFGSHRRWWSIGTKGTTVIIAVTGLLLVGLWIGRSLLGTLPPV